MALCSSCAQCGVCLYWFGLIVVGFGAVCSFFSPALDACVCDGALDCFGGRTAHSRWRALALDFVFLQGTSAECGVSELVWVHRGWV